LWFKTIYEMNSANPSFEDVVARVRGMMPPGTDDNAIHGMADSMYRVAPGTVKAALDDRMWDGVDLPQALQSIKCPTLMIHGDADKGGAMREQDIAFFKANAPAATVVRLPGADHGLGIQQQPDVFLGHLNAFLNTL
jgi:pimeloyl-ACP methyl ester carboxylesterase